jgi:tetratricopeptide (TPR) repeat protein
MKKTLQDLTIRGVKAMINRGRFPQAHRALDRVLALGPNNIVFLKLKSLLYAQEGNFEEETKIWLRIFDIYEEDLDALYYFQNLDYEERLNFYFSDYLPADGRRFLTQPQAVLNASIVGVLGCLLFILVHSWGLSYRLLSLTPVSLSFFVVLVLLPWLGLMVVYLRSLREITLTREGIRFATKLKLISLRWEDISSIYIAHSVSAYSNSLTMIFQPKRQNQGAVEIDLNPETTPIKARSFFVKEVWRHFPRPQYVDRTQLPPSFPGLASF